MMNTIFVFGGIGLSAILIIENLVAKMPAYVFIDSGSQAYILSIISILIGVMIGYGLKGMMDKDGGNDNDNDFNF